MGVGDVVWDFDCLCDGLCKSLCKIWGVGCGIGFGFVDDFVDCVIVDCGDRQVVGYGFDGGQIEWFVLKWCEQCD